MRRVAPGLAVAALAVGLWLGFGVTVWEIARFAGYQLLFVVGPGWLLWGALDPRASRLERLGFGWALGYALELGAYAGFAAAGARSAFVLYPLIALFLWRLIRPKETSPAPRTVPTPRHLAPALAAILALAFGYAALALFTQTPLPGEVAAVDYDKDVVYWLSLAAHAGHAWPLNDPNLAGEPLAYHWFAFIHLAATSDVTGIDLPVVLLRLDLLAMLAALALGLVAAATRLGFSAWAGVIAVGLVLLVGEIDLDPQTAFPYRGVFLTRLLTDPGILLGAVLLVPALVLLRERIDVSSLPRPGGWRPWLVLTVMLVGAFGAKGVIGPLVLLALALFALWRLVRTRSLELAPIAAGVLAAAVLGALFAVMYAGAESQLTFDALAVFDRGAVEQLYGLWVQYVPVLGEVEAIEPVFQIVVGTVALLGPLLAAIALLARLERGRTSGRGAWLVAVLLAGAIPTYLLRQDGNSHEFFLLYGAIAAALLAGAGLQAWLAGRTRAEAVSFALMTIAFAGVGLAGAYLSDASQSTLNALWLGTVVAAAGLSGLAVLRPRGGAPRRRAVRGAAIAGVALTLLAAGLLDAPLDLVPPLVERADAGDPAYSTENDNLTRGLSDALRFVREETPDDAVLAVSNRFRDADREDDRYFYYSGLGERPVFIEGAAYSTERGEIARRERLNAAVFERADPRAARTLACEHDVTHLLVDEVHGGAARGVAPLGEIVFSNADATIVRLARCRR